MVYFFSGFTCLIYQVVWQRLLTVNYGVGPVSITLIVSVYMFGLGLGSLLGGRLADRSSDPCALYAILEAGLGVAGVVSFPLILVLGRLTADKPPAVSTICLFAFLCLPTLLMGVSLPLLTTIFVRITGDLLHSVSRLYFINTLGAASGALLTGYLLISLLGLDGCIYLAAAFDFVLAAAILPARRSVRPETVTDRVEVPAPAQDCSLGRVAYAMVFITGFIAIGYEIVWYRVIGVIVKDSPYAFSSILAVYLLGVALGSLAIRACLVHRPETLRRAVFFNAQFLIGLIVLLTFTGYYYLARHTASQGLTHLSFSMELHPSLALLTRGRGWPSVENAYLFLDVFLWPLAFMFVPTILMGASFPLITSLALSRRGREGRAVGTTYFFQVLGNVLGGFVTGFVLLPAIGTERTVLVFGSMGLLFGLASRGIGGRQVPGLYRLVCTVVLVAGAAAVFPGRGELYAAMHTPPFASGTVLFEEGIDSVVFTYEDQGQFRNFINGQGHGYRPGPLFFAEAIEGLTHAPFLRQVLVIGFGAGSGTQAALIPSEVQRVTVVELCGSLITNLRKFPAMFDILNDRRVELVIDDGRRFLQRTPDQFDVILMDPLRTTTAYSNNLHSRQFFALAAKHLSPGGVLMVGGVEDNLVIPRTLLQEFPYVRTYLGYSLASKAPLRQNRSRLERLLGAFPVGTQAAIWSLAQDALEGSVLIEATSQYPVNQDWRPVSEYYLGLQLRQLLASRWK